VTKLKDVVFRPAPRKVKWVTTALQTITPKHRDLQQISIWTLYPSFVCNAGVYTDVKGAVGEAGYGEWLDLDRFLVQLWESRSIRPKVACTPRQTRQELVDLIECLLPEITKRGIIDLVEHPLA
jgi:hypothetical protein